jgi:tricarballylate dehydrogenase
MGGTGAALRDRSVTLAEVGDPEFDVIVIGCGVAGAAAAAAAVEEATSVGRPLRVVVLERTGPELRGGNSRWTAAYLRMTDVDTPAPGFVEDLMVQAGVERSYAARLANDAGPTLRWLEALGAEFGELPTIFLTQARPRLLPIGGGRALVDILLQTAQSAGATIAYHSTAWRLELRADGSVEGIHVRGGDGSSALGTAHAVVIASGGFEGNPEMMTRYVGQSVRTVALGGQHNRGEGIEMALAIGAKPTGEWSQFHAEPVDPRSPREEAVVMLYPYALLIDGTGQRFIDEGRATIDEQYEQTARRILALPDRRSWVVGDQRLFGLPRFDDIVQTTEPPMTAETVAELAIAIGVPPANLQRTITEYNAAVQPGRFEPRRLDGKATLGIDPPKSNWANPIDRPPFVAWPLECSNVFTFGGLGTDAEGNVLSRDDVPIPGLYAAGEVTGVYHGKYTGATSVLRGLVFGRRAGRNAARYAAQSRA